MLEKNRPVSLTLVVVMLNTGLYQAGLVWPAPMAERSEA